MLADHIPELVGRQLIWLAAAFERDHAHGHAPGQDGVNRPGSLASGVVAVEHEYRAIEVAHEQLRLRPRECRAHEPHRRIPGLMDRDRVEEAFDEDHDACLRGDCSMQVEEDERDRKSVCRERV